jgi:GPN-loop GTPase
MVLFGQIVVGPAGCGKTTYCMGMQMFVEAVGRSCKVVNLDFANDSLPYTPAIDVRELVSLEVRRERDHLGSRNLNLERTFTFVMRLF